MGPGVTLSAFEREELRAVLSLQSKAGLGDRGLATLVGRHGSAKAALRARGVQLDLLGSEPVGPEIDRWLREGFLPIPLTSPRYPTALHSLTDPPPVLFLQGEVACLEGPAVAVVGSRKASGVGRRMAESLGCVLASEGVTVVSGLALGIDGAAHRGALSVGGSTLAVLGAGIDVPYPPSHRKLFRDIRDQGLLVSEFEPGAPALRHHFPKRNRILAALAQAVVVVEAAEKSGALITVDHGLDLGREIFAVPGSVENRGARGTNALLADGAGVVTHPEDLVENLRISGILGPETPGPSKGGPSSVSSVPSELQPVLAALSTEPSTVAEIARAAALEPGEALAALTSLEMGGWARACPGFRYQTPAAPSRHRRNRGLLPPNPEA